MTDIKTNFHTHVQRCRHAGGTEEDFVKTAISLGLSQLGFSDHGPFPDKDFGMRMPFCELREYLDELNALTVKYQADIIIWKGLEIEYLPEYRNYYEELLTTWHFDYLLMGEHFYKDSEGNNANIYGPLPSTEHFLFYARSIAEGMKSGYFKAVAHPDLYMLNHFAWDKNCEEAADIIINTAVATDTVLEYNANGFRRKPEDFPDGFRHPYPHDAFWKMAAQAPVRVMVGSDCHNTPSLWDDTVELAYERLRAYGIEPIMELMQGAEQHEHTRYRKTGECDPGHSVQGIK